MSVQIDQEVLPLIYPICPRRLGIETLERGEERIEGSVTEPSEIVVVDGGERSN